MEGGRFVSFLGNCSRVVDHLCPAPNPFKALKLSNPPCFDYRRCLSGIWSIRKSLHCSTINTFFPAENRLYFQICNSFGHNSPFLSSEEENLQWKEILTLAYGGIKNTSRDNRWNQIHLANGFQFRIHVQLHSSAFKKESILLMVRI